MPWLSGLWRCFAWFERLEPISGPLWQHSLPSPVWVPQGSPSFALSSPPRILGTEFSMTFGAAFGIASMSSVTMAGSTDAILWGLPLEGEQRL